MGAIFMQCSKMYIRRSTNIKRKFATSEYGIMHGSLNAQSYVGMQNKPKRLGCYIYNRIKIELFCKHATQ